MAASAGGDSFELVVVGGGPGGYVAAIRAAQLGLATAIVEKRETFGGTCLNVGCIPSKALLDSSELYARAGKRFAVHGILIDGLKLDLAAMMARKRAVVTQLVNGVAGRLREEGVTMVRGTASLSAPDAVEVRLADGGLRTLKGASILLATGGAPARLPFLEADGKLVLTSTEALELPEVPRRLVVVGAGAVGLEIGSIWSRLGSEVTVVELMSQILPGWDEELARILHRSLTRQGIDLRTGATITEAKTGASSVSLEVKMADGSSSTLKASHVLLAAGRKPFTEGLGLEKAGVSPDARTGRIAVNDRFQAAPGIYAIGDLIAGPALAHKAEDEGIAVAEILAGGAAHVRYDTIPLVVYTDPEVASVGATERELKERGVAYRKGSYPFRANGRALALDSTEGMVKILADEKTDRLLGAQLAGPHVSELVAEIVSVMEFGGSAEDIARTVHAHPTLTEVVREAALDVDRRSIHGPPRKR